MGEEKQSKEKENEEVVMQAIGLDIGTTTISGVLLDPRTQQVVKARTVKNGSFLPTEHSWEKIQDPEKIIEIAKGLLEELLAEGEDVRWIGLTGQMHGIVYVDAQGRCVSPLYTWQDGRGEQRIFAGESVCEKLERETGDSFYTGYGLVTHLYQQWTGQVPKEAKKLCTIADYLGMILTGRKEPLMHSSNGASLGFFQVEERTFQRERLEQQGVLLTLLPEVVDSYEVLGTYGEIPVMVAIGDNQASFLGSVKDPEKTVLFNMGTGGQVSVLAEVPCKGNAIEVRPYNEGKYLLAGSSLCGGRAYASLEQFFRTYTEAAGLEGVDHYQVMSRLFAKPEVPLRVSTCFAGTRQEPVKRGYIEGIEVGNLTPGAFIYGVLEGMVEELYTMYEEVGEEIQKEKTLLVASGNGMRQNIHLQQLAEERFHLPLQIAENTEEAACGAALTGLS